MASKVTVIPRARAFQRSTRQSPYKMRLVIDQIRGKSVNEALALLKFSKKHAAKQIEKTLASAVANAEHKAREANEGIDVDDLFVTYAVINEGTPIKRFMPAAQGRATPIRKRTSHVEIVVGERVRPESSTGETKSAKKTARKTAAAADASAEAPAAEAKPAKKPAAKKTARKSAKKEGEE